MFVKYFFENFARIMRGRDLPHLQNIRSHHKRFHQLSTIVMENDITIFQEAFRESDPYVYTYNQITLCKMKGSVSIFILTVYR